jgi:Flp pilus assembly pilin Flp
MNKALRFAKRLLNDDSDQDLIEYALIAALIVSCPLGLVRVSESARGRV